MNKIYITLITISILAPISGLYSSTENETAAVTKEYELPDIQKKSWDRIKDDWMRNTYSSCLKKFRLRMTCDGCGYIYLRAEITIDGNGRLSSYRKTGENICSKKISPAVEKCFMKPLQDKTYPDELKNFKFETMLGTGLKC